MVGGVATGAGAYAQYGYETGYATEQAARNKVFGLDQQITGFRKSENRMPLTELGSVTVGHYAYGRTEGSISFDWVLSTPWCLGTILKPITTVASPDSHVYTPSKEIFPVSIEVGMDLVTANQVRVLLGCMCRSISLRSSIGEYVRCSGDFIFSAEKAVGTALDPSPAADTTGFIPYTFEHGAVQLPGGTTLTEVQSIDFGLNSNAELMYGHGSSKAVNGIRKLTEITGKVNMTMKDNVSLGYVNSRGEVASLNLKYTNGGDGDAERSIEFNFTGISFAEHGLPNVQANETIFEDLDWQAKSVTVTAKNDTDAIP